MNTDTDIGAENNVSGDDESIVTSFCEITGSDRESGRHFLEALGFDLDTAVSMYLENEQPPAVRPTPSHQRFTTSTHRTTFSSGSNEADSTFNSYGPPSVNNEDDDDSNMAANFLSHMRQNRGVVGPGGIPGLTVGGPVGPDGVTNALRQFMSQHGIQQDDDDDDYVEGGRPERYDQDGIRLPDPVRQQRLVGNSSFSRHGRDGEDAFARAEDPSVEWMFEPARHLSYMGSLEQARAVANSENRWLVVNIQSHNEFTSHLLNRDVWTNETIVDLFRTTFLFWQRGHTSRDGRDYMTMHKVTEDQLPHIAFIDPRTGAKKLTLTGQIETGDMAIRMVEFADSHPLKTPQRSAADSPAVTAQQNSSSSSGTSSSSAQSEGIASVPVADSPVVVAEPEVLPPAAGVDHGPVPQEPLESDAGVIKVSIKLMNGKTVARRYLSTDSVRGLFAVTAAALDAEVPGSSAREFDLMTRYPTTSLLTCADKTLGECSLAGSLVLMKWL
eukprot:gene21642-27682_t